MGEEITNFFKKKAKSILIKISVPIIAIFLIIAILAGSTKVVMKSNIENVIECSNDYFNEIIIDENGKITTSVTPEELWDYMLKKGYPVNKYLNGPNELARLLNAELITQLPDTRSNVNQDINWEEVFKGKNGTELENVLQGIIKFKRHDKDGNEYYLTYASPTEYYKWIEEYNINNDQKAREQALTHFTVRKESSRSNSGISGQGNQSIANEMISNISEKLINAAKITSATPSGYCLGWVDNVWNNAKLSYEAYGCAWCARDAHVVSTDRSNIPLGASVYSTGSGSHGRCTNKSADHIYGHVGIYIGNGQVMDSVQGIVRTISLDEWAPTNDTNQHNAWLGWGWEDGNKERGINVTSSINSTSTSASTSTSVSTSDTSGAHSIEDVIKAAESQLGQPYSHGHYSCADPGGLGFDCAGLVFWSFEQAGFENVPHSQCAVGASAPNRGMIDRVYENCGGSLIKDQSQLQRGDLLFYAGSGRESGHVAIYLGDGKRIHANGDCVAEDDNALNAKFIGGGPLFTNVSRTVNNTNTNNNSSSPGYKVVIATYKEVEKNVSYKGPDAENAASSFGISLETQPEYTLNTTTIDYESMVQPYTLQFGFLWSLLVVGQSKNFVMDLADLAYNSELEIGIYDNLTTTTDVDKWTYKQVTDAKIKGSVSCSGISYIVNHNHLYSQGDPLNEENGNITRTVVTRTNTATCALTRANTWIVDYEQNFKKLPSESNTQNGSKSLDNQTLQDWTEVDYSKDKCNIVGEKVEQIVAEVNDNRTNEYNEQIKQYGKENKSTSASNINSSLPSEPSYIGEGDVTINISMQTKIKRVEINDSTEDTVVTEKYTTDTKKSIIKDDQKTKPNFVTLFTSYEHRQFKHNILSATSWILEIMEENEKLANSVQIFKYLLYKATGINYGVTKLDYNDLLQMTSASSSGGVAGGALSVRECKLSREEFIRAVQSYAPAVSRSGTQKFRDNAGTLYDICVQEHLNPILCASQAYQEQNWVDGSSILNNYWGIAVFNGSNSGFVRSSFEDGVKMWCDFVNAIIAGETIPNLVNGSEWHEMDAIFATIDSHYKGDMSTIYDVFCQWAAPSNNASPQECAPYMVRYIDDCIVVIANNIFGAGSLDI